MSRRMMATAIIIIGILVAIMVLMANICIDRSNETIERVDRHIEEVMDE